MAIQKITFRPLNHTPSPEFLQLKSLMESRNPQNRDRKDFLITFSSKFGPKFEPIERVEAGIGIKSETNVPQLTKECRFAINHAYQHRDKYNIILNRFYPKWTREEQEDLAIAFMKAYNRPDMIAIIGRNKIYSRYLLEDPSTI